MVPLFSIKTNKNFGIGEILDIVPLIDWMTEHHIHILQILPICETAPQETCPYLALSGLALDPIYLSVYAWDDYKRSEAAQGIFASSIIQADLNLWRKSPHVCYEAIRSCKLHLMETAFQHFKKEELEKESDRARQFQAFIDEKAEWLEDYALFRLLKEKHDWRHWKDWPPVYQDRDPATLQLLQQEEKDRLLFIKYLQWAVWEQWKIARNHVNKRNVLIMGDMPFLVSQDSADVWSHRDLFSDRDSFGAPPDAFSKTGQDWGLPLFHWDAMEKTDFLWWRRRVREFSKIYDLIRLDHIVGFYRVWVMSKEGAPYFEPPGKGQQAERGLKLLKTIIQEAGRCVPIAEDLGIIPDFVALSLKKLKVAGHKILRWEKRDQQYVDPQSFPFISMATTGTHDTDTLATWWKTLPIEEREVFLAMIGKQADQVLPADPFSDTLHTAILDRLMGSGSAMVILPIQDLFGFSEQINRPGTVGFHNWRYRLPVTLSTLQKQPPYQNKLLTLRKLIDRHQRYWAFTPLIEEAQMHRKDHVPTPPVSY